MVRLVKEYCCCAIPILNAGIYVTLSEQFIVSLASGILAFVTPPLVGASVPSWVSKVFAIICFITAGVQLFGFMGVFRESTVIFRRYTTLHLFSVTALFSFSAAFIVISGTRHNTATSTCVKTFFPSDPASTKTALTGSDSEGKLLCNIFTWFGLGTMAGLWAVLAIFHAYLYFVISGYGSSQRDDHFNYYSLYSINSEPGGLSGVHPSFLPGDNIGMKNLNPGDAADTAWDARDSMETITFEKQQAAGYQPHRQLSQGSFYREEPPPGANVYAASGPAPGFNNRYHDPFYRDTEAAIGARYPGQ